MPIENAKIDVPLTYGEVMELMRGIDYLPNCMWVFHQPLREKLKNACRELLDQIQKEK